jgi:hypothetical protein
MTDFHTMRADMAESEIDEPRKRVGVIAERAITGLEPLFASLEHVFPVRFEPTDSTDLERFDGVLVLDPSALGDDPTALGDMPRGLMPGDLMPRDLPRLIISSGAARHREEHVVIGLSEDSGLARPLRGAAIPERTMVGEPSFPAPESSRVLASIGRTPVWWQVGDACESLCVSSYSLPELGEQETLREHLRAGCFMGLLPLLHFLDLVLGAQGWTLPPLRASFVIDDPNLHWPSYGFLEYQDLVNHASRHGYHVGLATVPLDGWLINSRAASLVRENRTVLSLLIHGNDHVARELGRLLTSQEAEPVIAQALRRIAALERRSGVAVDRVMAPPHGACSEQALAAMFRLGIEAACISRPYPWRDRLPAPTPLAGWHPAEMVAGGLPVLPRYSLSLPREDLVFRALLGQPLILYGHHQDFAHGLDLFAQAASDINALGDVQWGPLSAIARGNYSTLRVGETLRVKLHARRITIKAPAGVSALRIEVDEPLGGPGWRHLTHATGPLETTFAEGLDMTFADGLAVTEQLPIIDPAASIEVMLAADRPLDPAQASSTGFRPWPWIRRTLVEGRDRVQPLLAAGPGSKTQSRWRRFIKE